MAESVLKPLCVSEHKVRETYYSTTYNGTFSVNNVKGNWDITHISIPFEEEKEKLIRTKFNLDNEKLTTFYETFANRLLRSLQLMSEIHSINKPSLPDNFLKYVYTDIIPKQGRGSDIYIVSEPVVPLVGSEFVQQDNITLQNLLSLGARFIQTLKLLEGTGIHIGAIDLDSVCLTKNKEKPMIKFTSLLYGYKDGDDLYNILLTKPATCSNGVLDGLYPSSHTDLVSVMNLIYTMGCGCHYTEKCNFDIEPAYLPERIIDTISSVFASNDNDELLLKETGKQFFNSLRDIKNNIIENTVIPISIMEAPVLEQETCDQPVNEDKGGFTEAIPEVPLNNNFDKTYTEEAEKSYISDFDFGEIVYDESEIDTSADKQTLGKNDVKKTEEESSILKPVHQQKNKLILALIIEFVALVGLFAAIIFFFGDSIFGMFS